MKYRHAINFLRDSRHMVEITFKDESIAYGTSPQQQAFVDEIIDDLDQAIDILELQSIVRDRV